LRLVRVSRLVTGRSNSKGECAMTWQLIPWHWPPISDGKIVRSRVGASIGREPAASVPEAVEQPQRAIIPGDRVENQ
jgi:hypothetical protein